MDKNVLNTFLKVDSTRWNLSIKMNENRFRLILQNTAKTRYLSQKNILFKAQNVVTGYYNFRACTIWKFSVFGSVRFLNFGFGSVRFLQNPQFLVSVRFSFWLFGSQVPVQCTPYNTVPFVFYSSLTSINLEKYLNFIAIYIHRNQLKNCQ